MKKEHPFEGAFYFEQTGNLSFLVVLTGEEVIDVSEVNYTYQEFLEDVGKRKFLLFLKGKVELFNELVPNQDLVRAFYVKNLYNDDPLEITIFLNDRALVIKPDRDQVAVKTIFGQVTKLDYVRPLYDTEESLLEVTFTSEEKLRFSSHTDSGNEWKSEYSDYVKNLFIDLSK